MGFGVCFPHFQSLKSILKIFSLGDAVPVYYMNVHMDLQVNYVNEAEWSRLSFTIKCLQVKKILAFKHDATFYSLFKFPCTCSLALLHI